MRLTVVVVALGAALWLGWRVWGERHRPRPAPPSPVALPSTDRASTPVAVPARPPVQVRTQLDPEDPELRAAVEGLAAAVEPAIDSLGVSTVDSAMAEYARSGDLAELQARLDRVLATSPAEAGRLHAHFLSAKDAQCLFVLAKVAAGRPGAEGFAPWVETAESGSGDHRRFAMYALAGDDGARSLDALAKVWSDPSAGSARAAAGFVLEGRIDEMPAPRRESIHLVCREDLLHATDPEVQAEALHLLMIPRLAAQDRGLVVEALLTCRHESVRLAALQALALGDALADPTVSAALDRVLGDASTPERLRAAVHAVRSVPSK